MLKLKSGVATLIISNEEMEIVKCLEESGLLTKGVSETLKNEEQKRRMLLGTLGASFLGNLSTSKSTQIEQVKAQLE